MMHENIPGSANHPLRSSFMSKRQFYLFLGSLWICFSSLTFVLALIARFIYWSVQTRIGPYSYLPDSFSLLLIIPVLLFIIGLIFIILSCLKISKEEA